MRQERRLQIRQEGESGSGFLTVRTGNFKAGINWLHMDIFSGNTKLSVLADYNCRLLLVLSRLGVSGSFGEKTLAEICQKDGLDTDTVLLICRVYASGDFRPSAREVRRCRVEDVARYVRRSHDYYLRNAIESISNSIEKLVEPCRGPQQQIVMDFFYGYRDEILKHFAFEEDEVLPYVEGLAEGRMSEDFNIGYFESHHTNIDEKLSDLKNIVMKSLPPECDDSLRLGLLQDLYALQDDLRSHTCIEDHILVPMARILEGHHDLGRRHSELQSEDDRNAELSEREKEILVCVAKGLINKEIADELCISVNTVITHRRNITRKIGIRSIPGLTVYAILNNLIGIEDVE